MQCDLVGAEAKKNESKHLALGFNHAERPGIFIKKVMLFFKHVRAKVYSFECTFTCLCDVS